MKTESIHEHNGVVHVAPAKCEAMKDAILAVLPEGGGGMTWDNRVDAVASLVPEAYYPHLGSVRWYAKSVQLDLEAKRVIERLTGSKPLRFRKIARP